MGVNGRILILINLCYIIKILKLITPISIEREK